MMTKDTICVLFCSPRTAEELLATNPEVRDTLVASSYLDDDEAIVVAKDEFLAWVRGKDDESLRSD